MNTRFALALAATLALSACGYSALEPYDPSPDGENYIEQPEAGGQALDLGNQDEASDEGAVSDDVIE